MCDRHLKFIPEGQSSRSPGEDAAACPQLVRLHDPYLTLPRGSARRTLARLGYKLYCSALPSSATCLVISTSAGQHPRALTYFRWEKKHKMGVEWEIPAHQFCLNIPHPGEKVGSPGRPSTDIPMRGELLPSFTGNKPLPLPAKSQVSSSDNSG